MSYWTFTDIFEEAGPRFRPFHGGFGLLNYQSIKKPAFYAYDYLNKLGKIELADADSSSWACKDSSGNVQVLFWNFTNTLPDSINDQQYYSRDVPAKTIGNVKISISGMPEGSYDLKVYKIGYKVNDPYNTYLELGKPNQLTKQQVTFIKEKNDGSPIYNGMIKVKPGKPLLKELEIRQNDVFLITVTKFS